MCKNARNKSNFLKVFEHPSGLAHIIVEQVSDNYETSLTLFGELLVTHFSSWRKDAIQLAVPLMELANKRIVVD